MNPTRGPLHSQLPPLHLTKDLILWHLLKLIFSQYDLPVLELAVLVFLGVDCLIGEPRHYYFYYYFRLTYIMYLYLSITEISSIASEILIKILSTQ